METESPTETESPGPLTKPRTYTLRGLIPFVAIILATNAGAWFRLESISDARADDLVRQQEQRERDQARDVVLERYRDCVDLALIETKLRDAFKVVADTFPQSEALQELTGAIDVNFPRTVENCQVPPDDGE